MPIVSNETTRFRTIARSGLAPPNFAPIHPVRPNARTVATMVTWIRRSIHGPVTAISGSEPPSANAMNDESAACVGET